MKMSTVQLENSPACRLALPSIRWSFGWSLVGNLGFSICQWAALALIAKLGSADMVGQYALALAITAPVFMFTNLQLRAVQVTDARGVHRFTAFVRLRLLASTAGMSVIVAISFAAPWDTSTRLIVLVVAAAKVVESFSDILAGVMQKHERLDLVSISLLLRGGLSLVLFWIVFAQRRSLVAALATIVIAWFAVFVAYDLPIAQRLLSRNAVAGISRALALRDLVRLTLPLGVVMTLVSLNINIPRYVLENSAGRTELGIFASLGYLVLAVNLLVAALGQSVSVRLSRFYAAGERERFIALLAKLCAFGASIGVIGVPVAMLFGRPLLTLLYRPEYADHLTVFVFLVLSAGFTAVGSFLGYGLTAARVFRPQLWIMLATTLTTLVASLVLAPRFGMLGAALALLVSAIVFASTAAYILFHATRGRVPA